MSNLYAVLGLSRNCSADHIRLAYRALAKQHHPDINPTSQEAARHIRAINDAYEVLSDPDRREEYDAELKQAEKESIKKREGRVAVNIAQDLHVSVAEFVNGAVLEVQVRDPANPNGAETYELTIPPETAPGTRFRLPREAPFERGFVVVRVKLRPDARFKARGSDVRCDLNIRAQRATEGGYESVRGPTGNFLRVDIPPNIGRGEVVRVEGEGLPKLRGGRGDLLVRVLYRPDVRFTRGVKDRSSPPRRRLR